MFDLSGANEVVAALKAAGVRAALDPALLNLPGVWVQVVGFDLDTMDTFRTELRLALITRDADSKRAMESLTALAREVHPVIPVARARARTFLLPDGNLLPGLEVPTRTRNPVPVPPEPDPEP